MMHCPVCNSIDAGKIGTNQFYCWQCFIEFNVDEQNQVKLYYVEADGSLVPLGNAAEVKAFKHVP